MTREELWDEIGSWGLPYGVPTDVGVMYSDGVEVITAVWRRETKRKGREFGDTVKVTVALTRIGESDTFRASAEFDVSLTGWTWHRDGLTAKEAVRYLGRDTLRAMRVVRKLAGMVEGGEG